MSAEVLLLLWESERTKSVIPHGPQTPSSNRPWDSLESLWRPERTEWSLETQGMGSKVATALVEGLPHGSGSSALLLGWRLVPQVAQRAAAAGKRAEPVPIPVTQACSVAAEDRW